MPLTFVVIYLTHEMNIASTWCMCIENLFIGISASNLEIVNYFPRALPAFLTERCWHLAYK